MDGLGQVRELTPAPPEWRMDWDRISRSDLAFYAGEMEKTPQNPAYHGEGDVWTHTKMVCQALAGLDGFRALDEGERSVLFTAALLHDVGKIRATRWENENWTSPNHAAVGEKMARDLLWTRLELCGDTEKIRFREAVCAFVRRHALPLHVVDDTDPGRKLRSVSEAGTLAPALSFDRLCVLAEADAEGKLCPDRTEQVDRVRFSRLLAEEAGCLSAPYPFPDGHTRFSYLSGRDVPPEVPLYDDRWGPVILLSGLPGVGKDTWISQNCPHLPVVSLDAIRRELKIAPTDNQGPVAEEAKRRAREHLRRREPFVWNATNVTAEARRRPLELIHAYGAWTRIVYLETALEENLRRNAARRERVPENVIRALIAKLSPPAPDEAREVQWLCV